MTQGGLFTEYFLEQGIRKTSAWKALTDEQVDRFRTDLRDIFQEFPYATSPNETQTEDDLIWKVLDRLGWDSFLREQNLSRKGREDVPDGLLFINAGAKAAANKEAKGSDRYKNGVCIVEAKRWERKLDRKDARFSDGDVPSTQVLRYLRRVDIITSGKVLWGVLTNGRHWRLYFQGASSVSEDFLELDLPVLLGLSDFEPGLFDGDADHNIRLFMLFFGRDAFEQREEYEGRTFHGLALDEGRLWEQRVANDLSAVVFDRVFPDLVQGLVTHDGDRPPDLSRAWLDEVRDAALILLYRLLFVLYAEDRNLLPVHDHRYDDYGMRMKVRDDIERRMDKEDVFSDKLTNYYTHMQSLFLGIGEGDGSLGLPPYNGGLFHKQQAPLLTRAPLPDRVFAPVIDALSRTAADGRKQRINYRDLTVRQLGSIYERLLEHEVVPDTDPTSTLVAIRPNAFARKGSGSYYTPDSLVRLIIRRTLEPLLKEKEEAFEAEAIALASDRGKKAHRLERLETFDPAAAFLNLRVCDPAMGSGHFLVDLVDFMADRILDAMAMAKQTAEWLDYESPVATSIATIRDRILEQAQTHNWANVNEDHLDDRQIVRRMILKRVIYGVDKNPMAVELAKVSLWLHTFTVGAPLSFLDHHLRAGDSLFGEFVRPVEDITRQAEMFQNSLRQGMNAAKGMMKVERMTDADIAEAKLSASTFDTISTETEPLVRFLGLVQAFRWLAATDKDAQESLNDFLYGSYGEPMDIAMAPEISADLSYDPVTTPAAATGLESASKIRSKEEMTRRFRKHLAAARTLDAEQRFLHWEVAFPGVWTDWESVAPKGGFDAIVGNPPWDRIKLQQVEWFAARRAPIAHAQRAADRKRMIQQLKKDKDPLYDDFLRVGELAKSATTVARKQGQYPLLSGGDINLYSLFVERARRLIKPRGVLGLLVPSGIASDKGASAFFKDISTNGHLAALLDFENRHKNGNGNGNSNGKRFFPDVDSRFKFCVFIAGGPERTFDEATCGFFFHDVDEIEVEGGTFTLGPGDFAAVNPNTGTAPVFRTRRDADLTRAIYERVPVLVDHRKTPPATVFPVKYATMFHMTNDSNLFHTVKKLKSDGAYPVAGNLWKKGDTEYVPLYEGKMVQAYDHRAASVEVDATRLHRPGQPVSTTTDEHCDPNWCPSPQYYVNKNDLRGIENLPYLIGYKRISSSTNVRSFITCALPPSAIELNLSLILPDDNCRKTGLEMYPLLLGCMNSFVFDFVTRCKLHGQTLNWYIVEQLPVLPDASYDLKIGKVSARDLVRQEVLKLTYTAHDMKPFARDMGYEGAPFIWDEDDRRHSRARLDALYFMLYDIEREDADYILSTFPIVKKHDQATHNRYLTRDLVLNYMNAFKAGDTKSRIAL